MYPNPVIEDQHRRPFQSTSSEREECEGDGDDEVVSEDNEAHYEHGEVKGTAEDNATSFGGYIKPEDAVYREDEFVLKSASPKVADIQKTFENPQFHLPVMTKRTPLPAVRLESPHNYLPQSFPYHTHVVINCHPKCDCVCVFPIHQPKLEKQFNRTAMDSSMGSSEDEFEEELLHAAARHKSSVQARQPLREVSSLPPAMSCVIL